MRVKPTYSKTPLLQFVVDMFQLKACCTTNQSNGLGPQFSVEHGILIQAVKFLSFHGILRNLLLVDDFSWSAYKIQ